MESHHVTNWSGGHGERVGCQPACPHELHPYVPIRRPHRSSRTQNLLWVNGLKLCLGVCVSHCMCVPIMSPPRLPFAFFGTSSPSSVSFFGCGLVVVWQTRWHMAVSLVLSYIREECLEPPPLFLSVRWSLLCLPLTIWQESLPAPRAINTSVPSSPTLPLTALTSSCFSPNPPYSPPYTYKHTQHFLLHSDLKKPCLDSVPLCDSISWSACCGNLWIWNRHVSVYYLASFLAPNSPQGNELTLFRLF